MPSEECHYCHKTITRPNKYTCYDEAGNVYCIKAHRSFHLSGKTTTQSGYHALKLKTEQQDRILRKVDCLVHLMDRDPHCHGWAQRFERVLH